MYEQYRISGSTDRVFIEGAVRQSVKLNSEGFFKTLLTVPPRRCLDMLRIAAGVYALDRIAKRKRPNTNEHGIRQLHVTFAVAEVDFWQQSVVTKSLFDILTFLTGDDWHVDFDQAEQLPGDLGHQSYLALPKTSPPKNMALYSGGLDSAAGLANRVLEGANDFLLMSVGHQHGLHRRVETQLKALRGLVKHSSGVDVNFLHSTLTTSLDGGKAKRMRQQEQTQRSRAFLFCSAAAVAASTHTLQIIEIFENGIGAINLPLMTGMLGSGLSTRGAHPTFLRLMSEFAATVTEDPLTFTLPFKSKTKAEMLRPLALSESLANWLQKSRSCIHTSVRVAGKTHCGRCAACIERRQAFAAAGIQEDLSRYQTDVLNEPLAEKNDAAYLSLYRHDASKWKDGAASVRRRMNHHLRLTNIPEEEDESIGILQVRHAQEVLATFGTLQRKHESAVTPSPPAI